jgi:hypothetical protein
VPGEAATIDQAVKPSANWQGQLYAVGQTAQPTDCPSQSTDPGNTLCDHFQLTTQDSGVVDVLITWPNPVIGMTSNDFDLLVCIDFPVVTTTTDQDCFEGIFIAEDLGNEPNFATVTFPATAGTTYDIRVIPFSVIGSDYTGCAAYVPAGGTPDQSACGAPPPPPPPPPTTSTTCPANPATASSERRITGGANLTPDGSGNTHEHASLNVAQKFRNNSTTPTFQGKVNYQKDDQIKFKSTQITCATFYDEGADSKNDPKGSAEIRGFGRLETEDPVTGQETQSNSCFRAFARDSGDPGGSQNGGADQFSIEFTSPTTDPVSGQLICTFNNLPAQFVAPTIYSGNIDYHLNA